VANKFLLILLRRLEWCTTVCSVLMIAILLFNLLFRSMSSFRCVLRTAVQMPMLRGSRGWLFFGFRNTRFGKSSACWLRLQRTPIVNCAYTVAYSAKRGLQRGLRTPQIYGLGNWESNFFYVFREMFSIPVWSHCQMSLSFFVFSPPLRSSGPDVAATGSGEPFRFPRESGRCLVAKRYLVNFRLKSSPLVATIFRRFSGNEISNRSTVDR